MSWLQAHLTVTKEQAPLLELLFENLGAVSVLLGDAGDEPMLEPGPGEDVVDLLDQPQLGVGEVDGVQGVAGPPARKLLGAMITGPP